MTQDEFLKLNESLVKVEDDTTPYAVVTNNEIAVIGDAGKTEPKVHDYTIELRFPRRMEDQIHGITDKTDNFVFTNIEFKDVTITPQDDMKVVLAITKMLPFFLQARDDGTLDRINEGETNIRELLEMAEDELIDALYNVVATMLKVDEKIVPYMLPVSVFETVGQLIEDFPEAFAEADGFFESSTANTLKMVDAKKNQS